jgi:hypothetical protein
VGAGNEHEPTAAQALQPQVCPHAQDAPAIPAARMGLFQLHLVAEMQGQWTGTVWTETLSVWHVKAHLRGRARCGRAAPHAKVLALSSYPQQP